MAFFIQILIYWLILWGISQFIFKKQLHSHAKKGRIAFSVGFLVVGTMHFLKPESLTYMIDGFMPFAYELVLVTGIIEIGLAILLIGGKWQKSIGWITILYLIAIFPANIYVAVHKLPPPGGLPASPWYTWSRLFFQPIYILWVYFSAIRPEQKSERGKLRRTTG